MATAWPPTASRRNSLGAVTAQNVLLANVSANVILSSGYDAEGHRVSLSANIGGTLAGNGTVTGGIKDFINTYTFNTRGDMTGITQTAQTGGSDNGVAAKNVVLGYNNNGQIGSIAAYASTGTGSQVYSATDSYDANLRLTDLVYSAAGSTIAGYHLDYNSNSTVADEYVRNDTTGTPGASYTSWAELTNTVDHDSQLLSTSYSSNFANPPCGSGGSGGSGTQSYDANGNRTSASVPSYLTSDTGAGNRMLFDGTYTYAYDAAGNRILKWLNNNGVAESSPQPGDTGITLYTYDNHNQLTAVNYYTTYANYHASTNAWEVGYGYGPFGDLVSRTPTGLSGETAEYYVNDGQDLVLVLNSVAQVTERELNGPAVDQVLASETVTPGSGGGTQSAGTVNWLLSDGQGTMQDVAQFSGGSTYIADHLVFSPFGQITYQSASGSQPRFTYLGQRFDANVGLYYQGSGSSWYDAVNGVFASQGARAIMEASTIRSSSWATTPS